MFKDIRQEVGMNAFARVSELGSRFQFESVITI